MWRVHLYILSCDNDCPGSPALLCLAFPQLVTLWLSHYGLILDVKSGVGAGKLISIKKQTNNNNNNKKKKTAGGNESSKFPPNSSQARKKSPPPPPPLYDVVFTVFVNQ